MKENMKEFVKKIEENVKLQAELDEIGYIFENSDDEIQESGLLKLYGCASFEELEAKIANRDSEVKDLINFIKNRGWFYGEFTIRTLRLQRWKWT